MSKTLTLLAAVTILGGSHAALARLDETMAQCQERYGPEIEKLDAANPLSDPKISVFSRSGVTTAVEFKDGKAWRIIFRKLGMSRAEQELLLKANMAEGGWSAPLKIDNQEFRLSADKQRIAVLTPGKSPSSTVTLEIALRDFGVANHAAYAERVSAAIRGVGEAKVSKALEGF